LETITSTGEAIRRLKLKGYYGVGSDLTTFKDLQVIQRNFPNLEELEFELPRFQYNNTGGIHDRVCFEARDSLDFLPQVTSLKKLHRFREGDLGTPYYERDNIESTDIDYDNMEEIMRSLHANKVGIPFEKVRISLGRCLPPPNWQRVPGALIGEQGAKWSYCRRWSSHVNSAGQYEQWTELGYERVGDASEAMPKQHFETHLRMNMVGPDLIEEV
jgi:hypothetical protein